MSSSSERQSLGLLLTVIGGVIVLASACSDNVGRTASVPAVMGGPGTTTSGDGIGGSSGLASLLSLGWVAIFLLLPLWTMVAWLVLAALTEIERAGVRFFGRMHGRRITPAIATTIVSHAAAGWLVGAALLVRDRQAAGSATG